MKKLCNIFLVLLLMFTPVPRNVVAEDPTTDDVQITTQENEEVEEVTTDEAIIQEESEKEENIEVQGEFFVDETENPVNENVEIEEEQAHEKEVVEEISYPAFSDSKTIDDVKITVEAQEDVFPEGATLSVEKVAIYVEQQVTEAIDQVREQDKNVVTSYTFDIKILDSKGNEIQPKDDSKVKVSFTLAEATNENLDTNVYHIDDTQNNITSDNVQALEVITEGEEVIVETDSFSLYTVEFTYNNKQYVLDGDNYVKLYELLAHIGLTGEVSSWEVSNPTLFNIFKGTEDEVSYDYEIIDEYIYEIPIDNPDGDVLYIVPIQMFNTEEWLKVTIDGIEYEIKVTDDNIYQTVPSSYSGNISTNNDDNVAITGDTYFLDAPKPDYVMQSQSTTSARDFAAGLPLSTIFIDVDKIGNANNIGVQGEFTLLTENEAIKNGFEHYYSTDGSGNNMQLTGDVVVYNPLADTENLMQIEPNKINVLEGDLFQFIYRDAAILPNGNRAHVKMVYSNAKIAVDQRLGITHPASGLNASNYQGAIYLARGGTVARGGTDERYLGWRNRTLAQEPNQPFTQAQKQAMVNAVNNTLSTNWGQSYTITNANSTETPALGQSIDVKYQVVDDDGNPIDGTFIFAVTGINLDRDPYAVSGNNTAKPLWTYTATDSETHFFSEAMSINQGKMSDYIYVRPNTNIFESNELKQSAEASNPASKKYSYYYAQVIEDANGHVKFIGNNYGPTNLGGNDASYNAGFIVLANAKDGITITSTGHATSRLGMNTQAWGGVQIWYRYTSSTGPNGNIQTTSEGNYGGTLDDTSDHGVSSNILDPNTFVVPEGKTITYTLTPDENYQIAKLQVANSSGTMREIKYNGNKPLSSMQEGSVYRFNDAAGRQCILTALADGKFTLEVPYATHDEKFHVEWHRNNATVKVKKDTVGDKEGTFTFKAKAYKKEDVTTYSPVEIGSIWKNPETGDYEMTFISGATVSLTADEIAAILANATIDTKNFITDANYVWGAFLGQTNIHLSDIGVTYGEDDVLFVGFENLPTSLIGDNVGYALNTGYGAAGPERIYLFHPTTTIERDVMTYWNFNELEGQSSDPGWYEFTVDAGQEAELIVQEGYTYEVQEINDANWQLLDIDGNPIQTASGELTADNRNPSHDFLNREVPDLTIKKETLNNASGTFNFTANIYKEEEILGINHEVTIQAVISNGEISYTLNNAGEELEIPGVAIIPNGEYLFESGDDNLDSLMSIMLYSVKDEVPHNIEIDEDNWQVSANIDKALGIQVEEMINDGYTSASFEPVTYTFKTETKTIKIPYNPQSLPIGVQCNDGVCTFTLNNGQSITFENVPYGSKYEIVESPQDSWRLISKINDSGTLTENTTAKFINEKLLSLTIKKETDEDTGEEFNFKVRVKGWETIFTYDKEIGAMSTPYLSQTPHQGYIIQGYINGIKSPDFYGEDSTFTSTSNDWTLIQEANSGYVENGMFYNYGYDGGAFPTTTLNDSTRFEAYTYIDLEGNHVFYTNGDNHDIGVYGENYAGNGFYTFKLKTGEELTIPNIPHGYEYEIYEIDSQGNYVEVGDVFNTKWQLKSATNTSGTLEESTTSIFTNEIKRSSIKVNKETMGNESGEFNFKAKVHQPLPDNSNYAEITITKDSIEEFNENLPQYMVGFNFAATSGLIPPIIINGLEIPDLYFSAVDYSAVSEDIDSLPEDEQEAYNNQIELYNKVQALLVDAVNGESIFVVINGKTYPVIYQSEESSELSQKLRIMPIIFDLSDQLGEIGSDGYYEFTLENGESIEIENIPFGYKYEVYEETPEGWDLVSIDGLTPREKAKGTIESEEPYEHTFLNAKRHKLIFEKKVSGNMGDKYKEFEFEVKVYGEKLLFSDEVGEYLPANSAFGGTAGILFKNPELNQPLFKSHFNKFENGDFSDLMYDVVNLTYCRFDTGLEIWSPGNWDGDSLNNGDFYWDELSGRGVGSIGDQHFSIDYPTPFRGIENTKQGEVFAPDWIDLEEYGGEYKGDGVFTFKLKHGDKIEIEVPYGYEYEIVEKDYSDEGYKQKVDGKAGREVSGELTEDKNHLFENRNQAAVPTEIRIASYGAGLVCISILVILIIKKNRRKSYAS